MFRVARKIRVGRETGNTHIFFLGLRQTHGTDIPIITNSLDTLYIHCNLVENSIVDGEYSDVIYTVSTADLSRSYPFKDGRILKGF